VIFLLVCIDVYLLAVFGRAALGLVMNFESAQLRLYYHLSSLTDSLTA